MSPRRTSPPQEFGAHGKTINPPPPAERPDPPAASPRAKAAAAAQPLVAVTVPMPSADDTERGERMLLAAEARQIVTAEDYAAAGEDLLKVKAVSTRIEGNRVALKAPLLEAIRRFDAFFKAPLDFLTRAERSLKSKMGDYTDRQDELRREEQAKADEAARKETERLQAMAAKAQASGKVEKAQQLEVRAHAVVAPIIQRAAPMVAGIKERDEYEYEITNATLLPREYTMPDEKKIGAVVRAMRLDTNIPGVTVRRKTGIAARRG